MELVWPWLVCFCRAEGHRFDSQPGWTQFSGHMRPSDMSVSAGLSKERFSILLNTQNKAKSNITASPYKRYTL